VDPTITTGWGDDAASRGAPPWAEPFDDPTSDVLAVGCRRVLDEITPALARTARRFVGAKGWTLFGYARVDDYANEQLGRSGRWLRDLAALDDALERFDALRRAFTGVDGGRPIGQVAALAIGRTADEQTVECWIRLARQLPIRQFKNRIREARAAESTAPLLRTPDEGAPSSDDPSNESERVQVSFDVPDEVRAVFDDAVELNRMVCGSQLSVTAFVESLVAEASTVVRPWDIELPDSTPGAGRYDLESILFESTEQWSDLEVDPNAATKPFIAELTEAAVCVGRAGHGGSRELHAQLVALIRVEGRLQRRLGEILMRIGLERGWAALGFTGLRHYSEQRLGLRGSTTRDRVRVARTVCRFPLLHAAYESGEIGLEATLILLRIFVAADSVDPDFEKAWIARAQEATIRRLRDEARLLGRRAFSNSGSGSPRPMTDEGWYSGLHHRPGQIRQRLGKLCLHLFDDPDCRGRVTLRLPADLAGVFLGTIEAACEMLESRIAGSDEGGIALQLARKLFERYRRVPDWIGLLAVLEDFVETWDHDEGAPRRPAQAIYAREGWRCAAPGCTSRANLESHHIEYLSRGGDPTSPANQVCLCRFHHQLGEHGQFASCRGTAPLGLVWELGVDGIGGRFKNDRRAQVNSG